MKRYILKNIGLLLSLSFGLIFTSPLLAQNNKTLSFSSNCSASTSCNIFQISNICGTTFKLGTSHGSPRYIDYGNNRKAVRLDGLSTGEEGFFLNYTFVKGNDYAIEFDVIGPQASNYTNTYFKVDLANGVTTQDDGCNLGTAPSVSDVVSIINTNQYTYQAAKTLYATIQPSKNYSQLWLRSSSAGSVNTGVDVFYIKITETVNQQPAPVTCPATLTVPATNYSANTTVKASSTLTIQGNQTPNTGITATFTAGNSITISPNTILSPNISLTIAPCSSGGRIAYGEDAEVDEAESNNNEYMNAYPNPATDKVTVALLFEPTSETLIRVHDSYGKEINSTSFRKLNDTLYEVDMARQGSGLYFIRALAPGGWVSKKIVLIK